MKSVRKPGGDTERKAILIGMNIVVFQKKCLMKPVTLLFAILIALTVTSCKKEKDNQPEVSKNESRMVKWQHESWGSRITRLFEYNTNGKISKQTTVLPPIDQASGERVVTHTFQYGTNGKIATEEQLSPDGKIFYGHYSYNPDGRLNRFEYKDDTGLVVLSLDYVYAGSTIELKITHAPNGGVTNYKINLDGTGNISDIWCQWGINPEYWQAVSGTTYDNTPNVFSTIRGMECFYMLTSPDAFSGILPKNNILEYKSHTLNNGPVYSSGQIYEYSSTGLATKRLSEDGMTVDIFTYEEY